MRRSLTLIGLLVLLVFGLAPAGKARAATVSAKATRVVQIALKQRGAPYRWGGTSPQPGFDCSGFTRWVYAHVGITSPIRRTPSSPWSSGFAPPAEARRPALLLWARARRHVSRARPLHRRAAQRRARAHQLAGVQLGRDRRCPPHPRRLMSLHADAAEVADGHGAAVGPQGRHSAVAWRCVVPIRLLRDTIVRI